MHHPTDSHTTAFVTPVLEHCLELEIVQYIDHEKSIWQSITPQLDSLSLDCLDVVNIFILQVSTETQVMFYFVAFGI